MKYSTAYIRAGLVLSLILVLLTACGQPKETRADIFNPNGIKEMPVRDSYGTVNVPISAKNIAVTSQYAMDYMNAIGADISLAPKPAEGNYVFPPYTSDEQRNKLTLIEGQNGELDLNALAAEKPDLIITNNGDRATYDALAKIAPTAYIDPSLDWRSELYMYSTFLDHDTAAKQFMNAYQQKFNGAKTKLAPIVGTSTIAALSMQGNNLVLHNNVQNGVGEVLYQDLALKAPEGMTTDAESTPVTLQQLQSMNPNYLFVSTDIPNDTAAALSKRMAASADGAAWKQLTAVQSNHVYIVDSSFFNDTPLAKSYAIDTLIDELSAK
ncbi:ABC transporter substrate-binding protein [Paenibacillus sp. Z6-24]